jgi:predicted ATPase
LITKIAINNYRILREAVCEDVPRVMVVCGPNGVGKTTLLDAIGRAQGTTVDQGTRVVVAPATRTWRKEAVQQRSLYANATTSADAFAMTSQISTILSGLGRNAYSSTRDLWSDDDAKQLVKPLIAKLKTQWRDLVAGQIEQSEFRTPQREWPNPNSVLAEFTAALFDEIRYEDTVTQTSGNDLTTRVLFSSANTPGVSQEIDDLSSGEKAVFSIFLPVIEEEFRRLMGEPLRELTLVIDELEEHLHPSLQLRVLEYCRHRANDGYQFICTTHSTTLIRASAQTELFHVLPKGMTAGNQLRRAAGEIHSLVEVMQDHVLFASGYQRHILCEGFDPDRPDEANICDSELYTALLGPTKEQKIIAAGSRDALIAGLRAASHSVFAPLCLVSITDADDSVRPDPRAPWCQVVLPLYSLESVLLDPSAIAGALSVYGVTQEMAEQAIGRAVDRAIADRRTQLTLSPAACLAVKRDMSVESGLPLLGSGDVASVFEVRPDAVERIRSGLARLEEAGKDRQVALKAMKGKKIYHYLFDELGLRGRGFTHRSFALSVLGRIRAEKALSWLTDFERVVKRGVGNALTTLLLTEEGDALRGDPQYQGVITSVVELTDSIILDDQHYAVIRDSVRVETFAERLAPLATAVNAVKPAYVWDRIA